MTKKVFLPIILGSDENAYGNVRLIREKYDVVPLLLCKRLLIPTMHSKLFDYRCIADFDKEEIFVPTLLSVLREKSKEYEKLVVIACSDYYAALMSKNYESFEGLVANAFPSSELLACFETKDKFYALCDEYGLDYPKTVVCTKEERLSVVKTLPFSFPIVAKPENSNAYEYLHLSFEGKKKVYFLDSEKDYLRVAEALNRVGYTGKMILQEYIEGKDDAMRVINSYSDNEGVVRASCLGQPVLEEYAPYTLGNYAAIITRNESEVYERVRVFLEKIGYRGFSNIDMKYDAKTGRYLMFEINPRLGRSSYFVRTADINMMEELIESVVYNHSHAPHFADKRAMWSNVPLGILKKYVKNEELQKEIRELSKDCVFTLRCREDFSLKRFYRISRFYFSHYKNFRKYYFQK